MIKVNEIIIEVNTGVGDKVDNSLLIRKYNMDWLNKDTKSSVPMSMIR